MGTAPFPPGYELYVLQELQELLLQVWYLELATFTTSEFKNGDFRLHEFTSESKSFREIFNLGIVENRSFTAYVNAVYLAMTALSYPALHPSFQR
jgi:hypothetical protein